MDKKLSFNVNANTQFAVLGLGKFGSSVALELTKNNRKVLCCDTDEKVVQDLSYNIEHIVQGNATSDDFLQGVGISNFDIVVVTFSKNFEDSILTIMKLKEQGVPTVVVKASDERHKQVLEKVGADYVILPDAIMGERLGHALSFNDPLAYIDESDIYNIEQILPDKKWFNKQLSDLDLTNNENINILGIIRNDELVNRITADTVILPSDTLIVIKGS